MTPRDLYIQLAEMHGHGDDVRKLLADQPPPDIPIEPLHVALGRQRRIRNMSLGSVRVRGGISQSHASELEGGIYFKNPGLRTLMKLARGYDLPFVFVLVLALREVEKKWHR